MFMPAAMKHVILPDSERHSLAFYLAMEEFVARRYEDEAFFVWRVEPTVIIGRNQDLEAEVNIQYCNDHGVHIVRRKSGGGCVYSDLGNIMISYVSRRGDVAAVFDRYLSELTACLVSLGLAAEKSGRNDILVDGRKVSGNAFHQMPDRSIVHGTLLYDTDMDALENAIRPPVEKLERHGVPSVRQRVRNIAELAGEIESGIEPVSEHLRSVEALEQYIVEYFTGWKPEAHMPEKELRLNPEDVAEIAEMANDYKVRIRK
jgi:lipoic acid synthetase/lipoate-protein ligase A